MRVVKCELPGVLLVEPDIFEDARGWFFESFHAQRYAAMGIPGPFVQDNVSHSVRGTLRGLHYQLPPAAQGKLVGVVRGEIYDVAVDLRVGGATFGRWVGQRLDAETGTLLWIPPGFAHGYVVLSDVAEVAYKVTAEYAPELDRGVRWDDPAIGVAWPVTDPVVSMKDRAQPLLADAENPFRV